MNWDPADKLKFQPVEETCEARIRAVGIGGGGCHALDGTTEAGAENLGSIVVDTRLRSLNSSKARESLRAGRRPESRAAEAVESGHSAKIGRNAPRRYSGHRKYHRFAGCGDQLGETEEGPWVMKQQAR
jgi:hypothetical protein